MTVQMTYQVHRNGPLTKEAIDYLLQLKAEERWSYKVLGSHLGISEAFAYNLLHKGGNVSTDTYYRSIENGIARLKAGDLENGATATAKAQPLRDHSYHLREDLQLTLQLPADLTEREAERLSMFIRSLAH